MVNYGALPVNPSNVINIFYRRTIEPKAYIVDMYLHDNSFTRSWVSHQRDLRKRTRSKVLTIAVSCYQKKLYKCTKVG